MLLTFLYHRIDEGKYANSKKNIEDNFEHLAKKYKIILPGDRIALFKTNICLTFDDGYFDFYYFVFPLLKKYKIKAQLAVPVKYIEESTSLDPETRLSVPYAEGMKKPFLSKVPFCTWEELKEMSDSGYVSIASHSYSHKNLLDDDVDLHLEIVESKKIIEKKLSKEVTTFVYPLGKFNEEIHKLTLKHYKYSMRIGSTFNLSWKNINNITYRIISDNLKSKNEKIKVLPFISYLWFYFLNTFRGR